MSKIFELNKKKPFEFWDFIGKPKYVCAPMVDQSELSFRLLTRKYGVELAYSPMIHSVVFTTNDKYQKTWLNDIDNHNIESPLFVQFCGHDPEILLRAAKLVEGKCEGIDLNLGCPQGIAKRGNYGAYLLENTELVLKILGYLNNNITHSAITCKIRIFPEIEKTYEYVKEIQKCGVKVLTVHGRTKAEKGQMTKEVNWDAIKNIKQLVDIPIISNGGLETFEDVEKCFEYTKCDAVMSSEGLLDYPALFTKDKILNIDDIALDYLDISEKHNNDIDFVRSHMFKFMYRALQENPELNQKLAKCTSYTEFKEFTTNVRKSRLNIKNEKKLGYYRRYRQYDRNGELLVKDTKVNKKKPKEPENECEDDCYSDMINLFQ